MEAPQLLLNWEAPRLGADPASAATPPGAGPPGAAAVFTNSLLLMEDSLRSDSSGSRGASPQSQPLKSLAAAAAEAAASRRGGADGAHLIAALPLSRAASFEEHQVCAWRAAKQVRLRRDGGQCCKCLWPAGLGLCTPQR